MSQAETDSTTLPIPIPTLFNVTALAKREGITRRTIQRRLTKSWTPPVAPATPPVTRPRRTSQPEIAPATPTVSVIGTLTLVTAVALAAISASFGVTGMTAIFAAGALPIMVMVGVLEASKLDAARNRYRKWPRLLPSQSVLNGPASGVNYSGY